MSGHSDGCRSDSTLCRSLHNKATACINSLVFFSAMSGDGVKVM